MIFILLLVTILFIFNKVIIKERKFFKDLYIYAKTYAQELHNKAEIVKEYSVRNDVKSFLNHIVFLEIQSRKFNQEKLKELNQISSKENQSSIQSLKVI